MNIFVLNRGILFSRNIYIIIYNSLDTRQSNAKSFLYLFSTVYYLYLNPLIDVLSIRMQEHEANLNIAEVFCLKSFGQVKILAGPYIFSNTSKKSVANEGLENCSEICFRKLVYYMKISILLHEHLNV